MPAIPIKLAPRLIEKAGDRLHDAAVRGCKSAAFRGLQIIITQIIPSRSPQPVDRGVYRAGWHAYGTEDGAVIENLEPHAPIIEDGVRGPNVKIGRKMIDALAEWALRKGIATSGDERSVAWAIAKAMQRRGIFGAGLHVLDELIEKYLPSLLEEEIAREIEKNGLAD